MKKAGILTFWGVPNYGAWCQAYALNNVLREILGEEYEVVHIAYLHPTHFNFYYKHDLKLYNAFSYSWNIIPHTKAMTAKELEDAKFDLIGIGSDSIWEFSTPEMGNDIHLVGDRLNADRIVSLSASAGVTQPSDCDEWVGDGIKRLDYITVRDTSTQNLVSKLTERKSSLTLDPTLLWDFTRDEKVVPPSLEKYIAVYGAEWDDEFIFEIRRFAKKKHLKLISIGYINPWCDFSIKRTELRTLEWIGMFKYADYVATSTFHGLMFGIIFSKQIKFDQVPYVRERSETLLASLGGGLESFNQPNELSGLIRKENLLNYDVIQKKLSRFRKESIDIYREAVTGESAGVVE